MKAENKILLGLAGVIATFSMMPYNRMPKIIQDMSNVLSSLNPLSYLYNMITAMNVEQAIYDLLPGDHIYCHRRFGYSHHGIYAGKGEVWAYQGTNFADSKIQKVALVEFANGDNICKLNYDADFDRAVILQRAESRNMEDLYNVVNNNCMHFAYWCRLIPENIVATESIFSKLLN